MHHSTQVILEEQYLSLAPSVPWASGPSQGRRRNGSAVARASTQVATTAVIAMVAGLLTYSFTSVPEGHPVSTIDGVVTEDVSTIASDAYGYVKEFLVANNEPVKAGQVLATIVDKDSLANAQAKVDGTAADIADIKAQIDKYREMTAATLSSAGGDNARGHLSETLTHAMEQEGLLEARLISAEAALAKDEAAEHQVEQNATYKIVSPIDGTVAAKALGVGALVQIGTEVMQIAPPSTPYLLVNIPRSEVSAVRPGQPVDVHINGLSWTTIKGHVEGIAPEKDDDPSVADVGNFQNAAQRVPVKIALSLSPNLASKLRPGLSAEVALDTSTPSSPGESVQRVAQR